MLEVALEGIDRAVMFAAIRAEDLVDLDLLLALVYLQNDTLLSTDEVLEWGVL